MTIATVSQNNTFQQWLGSTNQAIGVLNQLTDGALVANGTITFTNSNFTLTVAGSGNIGNNLLLTATGGNTLFLLSSNAVINGTAYIKGSGVGLYVSNTAVANNIQTNWLTVANDTVATGNVSIGGNVFSKNITVAANTTTSNLTVNTSIVSSGVMTAFGNVSLTNVSVFGTASFGKAVSIFAPLIVGQLLTVNNSASIAANLVVGGNITAAGITGTDLSIIGNGDVTGAFSVQNITANNNATLGTFNSGQALIQGLGVNTAIISFGSSATVGNSVSNFVIANNSLTSGTDTQVGNSLFVTANTYLGQQAPVGSTQAIRADQVYMVSNPNPTSFSGVTSVTVPLPTNFNRFEIHLENVQMSVSGAQLYVNLSNNGGLSFVQSYSWALTFLNFGSSATSVQTSQSDSLLRISPTLQSGIGWDTSFKLYPGVNTGNYPRLYGMGTGTDSSGRFNHAWFAGSIGSLWPPGFNEATTILIGSSAGLMSGNVIVYGSQ